MRELGKKRAGDTPVESSQWWDKPTRTKPVVSNKSDTSSTKRTKIGKKI